MDEVASETGIPRTQLEPLLASASYQQSIVDAMSRPAERVLTWGEYREIFLRDNRINGGVEFWQANVEVLAQAELEFGVPAQIIVAIIGVETLYGRITGSYRVIDALSTLAFDYPARAPFFRSELKHFLTFTAQHERNPLDYKGSYAGAMGLGQFMPSSYRRYARDYTGDGFADLWESQADAIWSVANYLAEHGWQRGQPIAQQAAATPDFDRGLIDTELRPTYTLGDFRRAGLAVDASLAESMPAILVAMQGVESEELWLGFDNFYIITRYNISAMYALATYQLSEAILARRGEQSR